MVIIKENDLENTERLDILDNLQIAGGLIRVKLKAPEKQYFPYYTGAIIRASFLNFVNEQDQSLADWFHKSTEIKPYSTSKLQVDGRTQNRTKRKDMPLYIII